MTAGNNHLLQKVTFEIGLREQDGAFEIQNRITNAFRSGLLQELESLFNRIAREDEVITIDKIEINLGNLSTAKLEEDLFVTANREMENFLVSVEQELNEIRRNRDNETNSRSPALRSHDITIRWPVPNNPHFEARITVANDSVSWFEKVIYLLEHGIFPVAWTSSESAQLSDVLNKVLDGHSAQLVAFIRSKHSNHRILQRLVLNAKRDQLQYLAALLGCRFSFELPGIITELDSLLTTRNIAAQHFRQQAGFQFSETEQFLWFSILQYYSLRNESASQSLSGISSEKVVLVVRLLLKEPALLSRIFDAQEKPFSQLQQKQWTVVAPALDIIAPNILPHPEKIWNKARKRSQMASDENLSALEHTLISPEEIQRALRAEDSAPALFQKTVENTTEEPIETDLGIYISNAGLIILAPYLKPFFTNAGLLDGNKFTSPEAVHKAVHLLQYACGIEDDVPFEGYTEHDLVLNKILCGLEISEPVPEHFDLSAADKEMVEELLKAVLHNWTILQRSSIQTLQRTFLQKQGKLSKSGLNWEMLVERDSAVEILIDKLPWAISLVKLPWNDYTISTQW